LIPSIFAYKPVPPLDPGEPPSLGYPSRGIATLWSPASQPDPSAFIDLLGRTRTLLLQMLEEPLPTVGIARRLKVTPSAVSQHLQVLHATGLVTRACDRRHVHYRRSAAGDQLTAAMPSRLTCLTDSTSVSSAVSRLDQERPRPPRPSRRLDSGRRLRARPELQRSDRGRQLGRQVAAARSATPSGYAGDVRA
jgi:DNA-binding MarR family transcriptional regulator